MAHLPSRSGHSGQRQSESLRPPTVRGLQLRVFTPRCVDVKTATIPHGRFLTERVRPVFRRVLPSRHDEPRGTAFQTVAGSPQIRSACDPCQRARVQNRVQYRVQMRQRLGKIWKLGELKGCPLFVASSLRGQIFVAYRIHRVPGLRSRRLQVRILSGIMTYVNSSPGWHKYFGTDAVQWTWPRSDGTCLQVKALSPESPGTLSHAQRS